MKIFAWYYPRREEIGDQSEAASVLGKLQRLKASGVYFMAGEAEALADPAPLQALYERLQEAGLEVQLGFRPFSDPPNPTPEMLRRRYAYYEDGTLKYRGLCPAWPENRLLAIHRATQLCDIFKPAVLHLDYMRYFFANERSFGIELEWEEGERWLQTYHHCTCPLCQTERLELLGREPTDWDRHHPGYIFKRIGQRAEHVEEVLRGLRQLCDQREMKLTCAVRVQYLGRALVEGQDWVRWAQLGLVDSLSPMNYSPSLETVERRFTENQRLLRHLQMERIEGLARVSSAGETAPEQLAAQMRRVRELGADGVALFHLGVLSEADCEMLGEAVGD
jgi:hypothetical protein